MILKFTHDNTIKSILVIHSEFTQCERSSFQIIFKIYEKNNHWKCYGTGENNDCGVNGDEDCAGHIYNTNNVSMIRNILFVVHL